MCVCVGVCVCVCVCVCVVCACICEDGRVNCIPDVYKCAWSVIFAI